MIVFMLAVLPLVNSQDWNYGSLGPATWADNFPQCGGSNQSPINIEPGAAEYDPSLVAFGFRNYDKRANNELENTGTTARMLLGKNKGAYVYNGGLQGRYVTEGFHFRWGSDHRINGVQYPLELHIVSYNARFATFRDAIAASANEPDSVMAMAVLFELAPLDNRHLEPIVNALGLIQTAGSKAKISGGLRLENLLPFSAATNYYRYQGRFSNPPCFNTIWTVFADPVLISAKQLMAFTQLRDRDGNPLENAFRPVQELGERVVRFSLPPAMEFIPGAPIRKACVDVFLVIDESCSVYEDMPKVKQFIKDVVDGIIVGNDAVLMSLVRYSAPVNMNFYHSMTTSNEVVKEFIDTQQLGQLSTCRTHTSEALKFNSNRFFGLGEQANKTAERDYGIRNIAPDVMIIITDGTSIPLKGRPSALAEAAKLRGMGVEIYTIGLINQNDRDGSPELEGFTGNKDDHVFDINDEGLAMHFADIINSYKPCKQEKNCSELLDIVLVIDTSQSLLKAAEWSRIRKDPDNHHEIKSENLMAVKKFFKQLLAAIPIGIDKTRVAIVSFDEVVTIHQYLDDTVDYVHVKDTLTNSVIDYTGVGTRTDAALEYVLNRVLTKERGDREDVNNFIMLATDGVAFPCCTAGCCMASTGSNICPKTDYSCPTPAAATVAVKSVARQLNENWRNDIYVLALPNKPDRGDPAKKAAAARVAQSLYEALVRDTATGIKTLSQFSELENIVKEIINRVCAAADGLFLSPPAP